jgi:RNA polymerase sigma-70 factor (ECF subfamily)
MLFAYSRSRLASEADARELTQDTLVEAYFSLNRYELGTNFGLWLRSISRNLIRNHYRSLSRRREATLLEACLEIEDDTPPPELPIETLKSCMDKLDDVSRRVIEGFYREAQSVAALAAELGKGVSWVKVVLHRVRYRLRDCLARSGVEGLS